MATIQIPVIDVDLAIYHGTSDEVLNIGIGHFDFSSLPVGGKNTHCILTGHRGLPSAKLFTRLDELKKKDLIYVHACKKKLVYEVMDSYVVEPEEILKLQKLCVIKIKREAYFGCWIKPKRRWAAVCCGLGWNVRCCLP